MLKRWLDRLIPGRRGEKLDEIVLNKENVINLWNSISRGLELLGGNRYPVVDLKFVEVDEEILSRPNQLALEILRLSYGDLLARLPSLVGLVHNKVQ